MLGDELRQARLDAGLTQEKLAAKARVSREYISKIESGHQSPTIDTFFRICKSMNASPSTIIARVEDGKK